MTLLDLTPVFRVDECDHGNTIECVDCQPFGQRCNGITWIGNWENPPEFCEADATHYDHGWFCHEH